MNDPELYLIRCGEPYAVIERWSAICRVTIAAWQENDRWRWFNEGQGHQWTDIMEKLCLEKQLILAYTFKSNHTIQDEEDIIEIRTGDCMRTEGMYLDDLSVSQRITIEQKQELDREWERKRAERESTWVQRQLHPEEFYEPRDEWERVSIENMKRLGLPQSGYRPPPLKEGQMIGGSPRVRLRRWLRHFFLLDRA